MSRATKISGKTGQSQTRHSNQNRSSIAGDSSSRTHRSRHTFSLDRYTQERDAYLESLITARCDEKEHGSKLTEKLSRIDHCLSASNEEYDQARLDAEVKSKTLELERLKQVWDDAYSEHVEQEVRNLN